MGVPFDADRIKSILKPALESLNDETKNGPPASDSDAIPNSEWTFERVAEEYLRQITPRKKSLKDERNRIKQLQKSNLGSKLMTDVTAKIVYDYLTGLRHHKTGNALASVSIRNTAFLISSIFEISGASKIQGGFGIKGLSNPIRAISLPSPPKAAKQRNIDPDILKDFFQSIAKIESQYTPWLEVFLILALQTGMRRSELISLEWRAIHKTTQGFTVKLNETKSGYARTVFLDHSCSQRLLALKKLHPPGATTQILSDSRIFPFSKEYASRKFREVMRKIGYREIRLHDLRHTALTSMANAGFSLKELMAQSGHRTAAVASRYIHVDEKIIREKLSKLTH